MYQNKLLPMLLLFTIFFFSCENEMKIDEPGNLVPKTADQNSSLPSIVINGAKLHAETFGNPNDPIIFILHGGPAADYRYLLNCKEFADNGYFVVFYDQRGTGLSQRFPGSYYTGIQTSFDDLNSVIAHYRKSPTQKIFLLGHSWGAMLAGAYINQYPTAINGAVLAEPGGLKWNDIEGYVKRSQKMNITSEALNNAIYMDQFLTGNEDEHIILDYKFKLLASTGDENAIVGNEGTLPFWRPGFVLQDAYFNIIKKENSDWTTNLKQFKTKILFIYSERNKAYGLAHAQNVSSAFINVQLFETKGAGHDMLSFPTGWNNTKPAILTYFNALK
ncbi:alpha/beta fold hydrolase [Flavobacterium sp. 5]|uniref:alpha/beta hydrolase n=1 Tax=Flavobacterium sp. 5 TaxID=2035199 RepID=UPI000C2C1265|nr:alpha/beta hydrolase [Flavobacterium sp. 5]PKB18780.1 proline iminopeptidase [Flavobacterium sp. 5]